MLYSINYDLKGPVADYGSLIAAIKELGKWWHYLDSMWLVKSSMSSKEIYEKLGPNLKSGDSLVIFDITRSSYYGILPRDAWPWIADRQREERSGE